jgi:hypothetical protein
VVVEVAGDDTLQRDPLFGNRLVHPLSQPLFDFLELHPHAITSAPPFEKEPPAPRLTTDEGKTKKIEGFRFSEPAPGTPSRRMAAELNQAGLLRM